MRPDGRHTKSRLILWRAFVRSHALVGLDRRTILKTAGIVVCSPLAGCGSDEPADEADSPDPPWAPSEPIESPDGVHHLYVVNHTDTSEAAWLLVVREDGATLVCSRYELPDGRGSSWKRLPPGRRPTRSTWRSTV